MAARTIPTSPTIPGTSAKTDRGPQYDSIKASKRFIRSLAWVVIVCALFLGGQLLRYHFSQSQLDLIKTETDKLYHSVLGQDIGQSPFGRLQFEQGKLSAVRRIGLDPLSMLAALSLPAGENIRVEGVTLNGKPDVCAVSSAPMWKVLTATSTPCPKTSNSSFRWKSGKKCSAASHSA